MAVKLIDYMEYSTDALALEKWVSNAGYDSYTKLLSHFDGADGATAYTDPIAGAATFYGTAQLDTAQKKFGTASLLLDGDSDYVTYPNNDRLDFGTGAFTIDLWMRPKTGFASAAYRFISRNTKYPFDTEGWTFGFGHNASWGSNVRLNFAYDASGIIDTASNEISITADSWYHVAVVRSGTTLTFYLNGNSVGTATVSASLNPNIDCYIGSNYVTQELFNGYIDEVRVSNYARWTSNFTPDTVPYGVLQSYSESSIKTQGSYSLKVIVAKTDSLNKTLTFTPASSIDLSGSKNIKFQTRASRTGSNFKIGFHDSGGTTTEVTLNISSADTWQEVNLDISSVSDVNKDAIDKVILTITNADEENIIYIDNMYGITPRKRVIIV